MLCDGSIFKSGFVHASNANWFLEIGCNIVLCADFGNVLRWSVSVITIL